MVSLSRESLVISIKPSNSIHFKKSKIQYEAFRKLESYNLIRFQRQTITNGPGLHRQRPQEVILPILPTWEHPMRCFPRSTDRHHVPTMLVRRPWILQILELCRNNALLQVTQLRLYFILTS